MRMRKKKGWALLLVAALLTGLLPVGTAPVSKAEETSAPAGKYGLKNPVVKAVSPPENTSHGLSNPRNENGTVTWDCVEFGSYWQNDTNGDGVADKNDEKEPIKWRVLSVDGDDAFLLADTNLDVQRYNDTGGTVIQDKADVTWETCTMRSWLNGYGADKNICGKDYSDNNFLDNAFTESEQAAIKDTVVVNEDDLRSRENGNNTIDKVYLLSFSEAIEPMYGFNPMETFSETREATEKDSDGAWCFRSMANLSYLPAHVTTGGKIHTDWFVCVHSGTAGGGSSYVESFAVRPVLHLNLSFVSGWSQAGTVSSEGGEMTATWDCVWFGNYWANDTNGDGIADQNDKKEPIKWRVLSVNDDDVFLLADKNLDAHRYNDTREDVTWETCTMRTWLNSTFFTEAFNTSEQTAIQNTTVINEDNPQYGTKGGNNTTDKVYLLSFREITNPAYGFVPTRKATNTRKAIRTAYADAKDDSSRHMYSQYNYWLRSPGNDGSTASYVCGDTAFYATYGGVYQYGYNVDRDYDAVGVRPVLHLNLSDTSVWSYAGTVSSTGEENELPAPNPSATSSPSAGGPSVTGNPSVPQNSTTVTSSASARDIQVEAKEEGQRKNEKLTLAKVTGLKLKVKKKAIEASWKKASGATVR